MISLSPQVINQLISFSCIGAIAACIHLSSAIFITEIFKISPLIANGLAFMIAFQFSYFGQSYWTFRKNKKNHSEALPRFLMLQFSGFIFNEFLLFILIDFFTLNYIYSLIFSLGMTAFFTFFVSKFWVFKE